VDDKLAIDEDPFGFAPGGSLTILGQNPAQPSTVSNLGVPATSLGQTTVVDVVIASSNLCHGGHIEGSARKPSAQDSGSSGVMAAGA